MKFDFYLSEMSVSDLHGGGLTLQRVIREDLADIPCFVHVNRFGVDMPASAKFLDRCINLTSFWEQDAVRSKIGRSMAATLNKKLFFIRLHAKKAARILAKKIEKKSVSALICPQGAVSIYTLEELKRYKTIKYISWVMDDHLVKYINGNWEYPKGVEQVFKQHLREAEHVFVISPAMQDFYRNRFGVESTVLFGSANLHTRDRRPDLKAAETLKIGYFGAVTTWQLDVLQGLATSLNGTNTQLDIYSAVPKLPAELCVEGVIFEGRLNPDLVLTTMAKYDAILLPISFMEKMRSMSEFNIATKMSECLASGVPVLAIGPGYSAMIKYLKKNNAAVVVESNNDEDFKHALGLLRDEKYVSEILQNAERLAISETGTVPMHKRWLEIVD